MSTIVDRVDALAVAVGDELQTTNTNVGDLTALTTTDKSNLVAAINEVLLSAGVSINDAVTNVSSVWSSSKTSAEIAAAIVGVAVLNDAATNATEGWTSNKIQAEINNGLASLVGTAGATLDTIEELAAAFGNNPAAITEILSAQALRVRVDAAQAFTAPQQTQGRVNISAADVALYGADVTAADFVATFNTALTT